MLIQGNYKREVEQAVKRFRKDVDKIRNSDNPYYKAKDVQDYEIQQLRKALETTVQDVESRFNAELDGELEQAERLAVRSFFTPTTNDKLIVADSVSELVADVTFAFTDAEKVDAFDRFEARIEQLEVNGLSEVRRKLPEVLSAIGQDQVITKKLKTLNATLRQIRTPEQEQHDELLDLQSNGVAQEFSRLKMTHPAFKDDTNNRYHGQAI